MPYPMNQIIKNALEGVAKAQRDYEYWSGYWLLDAPEYFMTTCIAQEISTRRPFNYSLTLEHIVREAIDVAGGMGRGRPRNDLRSAGKFDILLSEKDGIPRTIIEVKRDMKRFQTIEQDVARICSVLDHNTSIQNGLVVYYSAIIDGNPDTLTERMGDRLTIVEDAARDLVNQRGMRLYRHRRPTAVVQDSAWTAGVIRIRGN